MDKPPENNPESSENHSDTPVVNNNYNQAPPDQYLDGSGQNLASFAQQCDDGYLDQLPSGFRFLPDDEELVSEYLLPKIDDKELPPNRIHEVNVYDYSPGELTEKYRSQGDNGWYFFTPRERKYAKGGRPKRGTKEGDDEDFGYWKATGSDKEVMKNNVQIGSRKTLVYYKGKPPNGVKQTWIMHEYVVTTRSIKANGKDMKLDKVVLCKIYKNYERRNARNGLGKHNQPKFQARAPTQVQSYAQAQARAQQVGYGEQGSNKNDSKESSFISSHMNIGNAYNYHNPYDLSFIKEKPPVPIIGSSFSTYHASQKYQDIGFIGSSSSPFDPSQKYNMMGLQHQQNSYMDIGNSYNNGVLEDQWYANQNIDPVPFSTPSSSAYNVSYASGEYPNMCFQHSYNANMVDHMISGTPCGLLSCTCLEPPMNVIPSLPSPHLFYPSFDSDGKGYCDNIAHTNEYPPWPTTTTVMDDDLTTMMAFGEGGPSGEDVDVLNNDINDFLKKISASPDMNMEQLSHIHREGGDEQPQQPEK